MANNDTQFQRLAVITELVKQAPGGFGRTALMKCLFFLKTLRNVPLPYTFTLYTYGPFDADVLDDLRYAESLGAIESTLVAYHGGYGYVLSIGAQAEAIEGRASEFLSQHQESIDWVIGEFGDRSASDLEMASTLVYVDRTVAEKGTSVSTKELAKTVNDVKPHLAAITIEREAQDLKEKGFLKAVA